MAAILLLVLISLRIPIPAYVALPGPAFPLADAIEIDGVEPIAGDFLFLTVQLDDARLVDVVTTVVAPEEDLVSRASVLQGESEEDFIDRQLALFEEAEEQAVTMGLALAGSELTAADVTVDTEGVGGPSAGLLTALAVADLASPLDVAAGRVIAGSGTLEADGSVGVVGGIEDKVRAAVDAGASVFLVADDLAEAARAADPDLTVIGVTSVEEAFDALLGG
ncbi:hypothetical protein [Euzebya tangerina]|uniref:hypothetical protein n=1 Tax=Euzebya tangerina TaxID=591198 RepID=UPI000E30D0E2|nr:hypothetical protein [Euzebya tangerina]